MEAKIVSKLRRFAEALAGLGLADSANVMDEAAAIIERLPVTTDGVPVLPSDPVWLVYRSPAGIIVSPRAEASDYIEDGKWDMHTHWLGFYSTEAAARAAAEAWGRELERRAQSWTEGQLREAEAAKGGGE